MGFPILVRGHNNFYWIRPLKLRCLRERASANNGYYATVHTNGLLTGALLSPGVITQVGTWAPPGLGLLNQYVPFRYFPRFSDLPRHHSPIEYHVHIWQGYHYRSLAAVIPVNDKFDSKGPISYFWQVNITIEALVTTNPGQKLKPFSCYPGNS